MSDLVFRYWHEGLNADECVSVDGDAPGRLHLSHWPKNRTPVEFRHDLSTGSCLLLNKSEKRGQLLQGITTVTNNHWDTDGLCSVYALLNPKPALEHAATLISAAMSGDFEMFTTPEGVKINLTLTALTKHNYSQVRTGLFGTELEARIAQYKYGLELLPKLLENPDLHADWFAQEYWTVMRDMRAIREDNVRVKRHDVMDMAEIRSDRLYHPMAVNTIADASSVLEVVEQEGGNLYNLRLTTRSWFDLVSRPPTRRVRRDWTRAVETLNLLLPAPGGTWIAGDWRGPTAELRFADADENPVPNPAKPTDVSNTLVSMLYSDLYLSTRNPPTPAGPATET